MSGEDEPFLSRWSRRKRKPEPEPEPEAPAPAAPQQTTRPGPASESEPETEAEVLDRLDLPDPDSLKPGDDFAAFMNKAVPEALRKRALRRLWRSNPVLANLDGLNDYDGDFTGGTVARGELKTAYRVGRGFLRDLVEDEAPAEAATREPDPDATAETAKPAETQAESAPAADTPDPADDSSPGTQSRQPRRRMAFRYSDAGDRPAGHDEKR